MGKREKNVDVYIVRSAIFAQPILQHFRDLVHQVCPEVEEKIKWGFPHFDYKGLMCSMAAFKKHCSIGFWKATLMKDKRLVENAKAEIAMGHLGKITSLDELPSDKILSGYVREAMKLNADGVKIEKPKPAPKKALPVPIYLTKALTRDKKAQAYFKTLSPSHKKEYIEWLEEAKTEETRNKRLATTVEWLGEAKPRNWKYAKK